MIRKGLIVVVILFVLLLIVAATQPDSFHIERSAMINAPQDVVFSHVNDLHAWSSWSPWEKLDPNMKKTFEGPEAGVGASYAWAGNDDVGEGKMTVTKSESPSQVILRLEFIKPFEATNTTTFSFHKMAGGTHTTWAMDGTNSFMGKIFSLFMDMDTMIGKDFDKGLATLKGIAESHAAKAAAKPAAEPEPAAKENEVDEEAEGEQQAE